MLHRRICLAAPLTMLVSLLPAIAEQAKAPSSLTKSELTREMQRLENEIWSRSLDCAGEAVVAPLEAELNALGEAYQARFRDAVDPLDQGGDVCAGATVIPSIPYTDAGTTSGYADDYLTPCYSGGSSPDVVYRFTPSMDMTLDVSLCGSSFNTVLSIWLGCPGSDEPVMLCCNDDSPDCAPQSCCSGFNFVRNITYYIIVDGAAGESGNYQLVMDYSVLPSCFVGLGCTVCPPGSNYENELCPATYPDPNAGPACFGSGYELINCGETMCGKATHTNTWLDRDAYWITLHQRDSIRFCIVAEFDVTITLYEFFPG
ncbi:MAG: hypothetical protein IPG71_05730 [bacterium]|nr:hypothetical protein [bacterium]